LDSNTASFRFKGTRRSAGVDHGVAKLLLVARDSAESHRANPVVRGAEGGHDLGCLIGRAVVDDHDLQIAQGLSQD
jgi:hypothetical protein